MALDGIDVSTWQPADITKRVDYDFAIMKASEGTAVARHCDTQVQHARRRGKLFGVYHFAALGSSPRAQADFFVQHVKGYVGEGILVLDLEGSALPAWGAKGALEFLDRVRDLTGVRPLLYTFGSALGSLKAVADAGYGLWTAHWNNRTRGSYSMPPAPMIGGWEFAAIHQYTDRGRLSGYGGDLDLNVFHGDREAWCAYAGATGKDETPAKPKPKPEPKPSVEKLAVDGLLGSKTISRWQEVMGTPVDGEIWRPSDLVEAVQRDLNKSGARDWDGKKLTVDGLGIGPNLTTAAGKTRTIWALQDDLGTTTDGILSKGGSPAVKAVQRRLNEDTF